MTPGDAIANCGGRRFLLTVGCGVVSTLLLVGDHIGEQSFVTIVIATVAAYITGNTVQKHIDSKAKGG